MMEFLRSSTSVCRPSGVSDFYSDAMEEAGFAAASVTASGCTLDTCEASSKRGDRKLQGPFAIAPMDEGLNVIFLVGGRESWTTACLAASMVQLGQAAVAAGRSALGGVPRLGEPKLPRPFLCMQARYQDYMHRISNQADVVESGGFVAGAGPSCRLPCMGRQSRHPCASSTAKHSTAQHSAAQHGCSTEPAFPPLRSQVSC